jgi:hypothetical protein
VIPNLTKMLDEINRIYAPGVERFFARLEPDLWTISVDDLEKHILDPDTAVSLQSIAIYKARRKRMVDLYRSFMEIAQKDYPRNEIIEAIQAELYADASEQTTRRLVRCDQCGGTPESSGPVRITATEDVNEAGDPTVWCHTICRPCAIQNQRGISA